jgi:hypothetical protein
MPENSMTLEAILDIDFLKDYIEADGIVVADDMYVYGSVAENGKFLPFKKAEILWDDWATRTSTGQPVYGLEEFSTVAECLSLLNACENDPLEVIDFVNKEGNYLEDK